MQVVKEHLVNLKSLELSYGPNAAILSGYVYLAGRVAGKQPPTAPIEAWLQKE
jgi:hypothetical protein